VCCTESERAWLLVSLGAQRAIATLELVVAQDMTFTLALANVTDGAWVTVAAHTCVTCVMNISPPDDAALVFDVTRGGRPVVASHIKLLITWSSGGGMGGCADMCDWYVCACFRAPVGSLQSRGD
jgi:hypothetical protein